MPKKSVMRQKWAEDPDYVKASGGKLHDYQLEGINWIRFSYAQVNFSFLLVSEVAVIVARCWQFHSLLKSFVERFARWPGKSAGSEERQNRTTECFLTITEHERDFG